MKSVREASEVVVRYMAPFSSEHRGEAVRRLRVDEQGRIMASLSDIVATVQRRAEEGWHAVADYLLGREVQRRLSQARVTIAGVIECAGIPVPTATDAPLR